MSIKPRPGAPRVSPALGPAKDPRARQSGTAEVEFPLVYENGVLKLTLAGNSPLAIDPQRGLYERVADGVEVSSASPYATRIALGDGLMLVKGRIEPRTSRSVRINAKKELVATPLAEDVVEAGGGTVQQSLDRKVNTADRRLSIARGTIALVAGTVPVAIASVEAGAVVMLTRQAAGGTIGDLTYTVTAGVGIDINSSDVLDTSTVAYIVWQPFP